MADTIESTPSEPTIGSPQGFRDSTELTKWLKILLWSGIVLLAIGIWSGWLELQILADIKNGFDVSDADIESSDARQGLIGIAQMVLYIITAIVFLKWIHRACHNARTIAASQMNFTPGWSVGWYFVPIANLYKPFKAMEEIYRVSENPAVNFKQKDTVPIVSAWWGLWILSGVVGQFVFRKSMSAETLAELYDSSLWTFAGDLIDIPLYLVALAMIGRIFEMQMSRVRGVSLST